MFFLIIFLLISPFDLHSNFRSYISTSSCEQEWHQVFTTNSKLSIFTKRKKLFMYTVATFLVTLISISDIAYLLTVTKESVLYNTLIKGHSNGIKINYSLNLEKTVLQVYHKASQKYNLLL